ncbi:MAG: hypothetical protein ACO1SV_17015 [Fimbriimonas sp.]
MTTSRIALSVIGLAVLGFGLATTTGMSRPAVASLGPNLKLDGRTEAALDTLHEEIQRRFHDRTDVDFGFSRMFRPKARLHNDTPLMGHWGTYQKEDSREREVIKDGKPFRIYEVKDPEMGWTTMMDLRNRPKMLPENDREAQAIGTLLRSEVDVAIYTFGLLGLEEIPVRAKGPGYLSRRAPDGPPASAMVKFAEQAWRTKNDDVILQGPDGWYLMAHRVEADKEDCVKCHAHNRPASPQGGIQPPGTRTLYAAGDDLGMVVIAVRPRKPR